MAASSNMFGKLSLTKSQPHCGKGKKQPELLPPSSFETVPKPPDDNWKERAQATAEILQLTQENLRLRESTHVKTPVVQEVAIDTRQAAPAAPLVDVRHLDDIISRQAVEIAGLRRQLAEFESQAHRQVALLESQLMLKDAQYTQQVAALEGEIRTLKETQARQSVEKEKELSDQEGKWSVEVQRLRDAMDSSAQTYNEHVAQLKEKLGTAEALVSKTQTETVERLRQYEEELRTRNEAINQLKRYLGESEQVSKSTEIWRQETESLKHKLQHCECKRRELESSSQLLNVRLTSLNEIFTIQEREISGLDSTGKDSITDKKHTLLTRWREKVYQLLVQLKSAGLTQQATHTDWQLKLQNVVNELDSSRSQCQVLEHSLSDRQAQLDLTAMTASTMQHELRAAQELAVELDDRNKQQKQVVSELVDTVQSIYERYCSTAKQQQSALVKLSTFSQRVAFASGRMEMLRSQFARREALLRLQTTDGATKPVNAPQSDDGVRSELFDQLRCELDRVTTERDQLVAQVKTDADQLEGIVASVRSQAAGEIDTLTQRVKDLEVTAEDRHKKSVSLTEELSQAKAEAEEAKEAVESLKADIARRDMQADKDVESVKSALAAEYTEQLAELERRLNDARREHTKAVVAQRQIERQATRERDRAAEQLRSVEEHYKHQVATLDKKLKSMESDRNLLMATLRQEGLVGKYKSQRAAPVGLSSEEPLVSRDGSGDRRTKREPPVPAEPLESVISDLKSLTAAIIEETSLE